MLPSWTEAVGVDMERVKRTPVWGLSQRKVCQRLTAEALESASWLVAVVVVKLVV